MKPATSVKTHTYTEANLYIGHIYLKLIFVFSGQRLIKSVKACSCSISGYSVIPTMCTPDCRPGVHQRLFLTESDQYIGGLNLSFVII